MFVLAFLLASASAIFVPAEHALSREAQIGSGTGGLGGIGGGHHSFCMSIKMSRDGAVSNCLACKKWIEAVCTGSKQTGFEKGFDKLPPCPCKANDLVTNGNWNPGWSNDKACKYVGCPGGNPPAGHCSPYHNGAAFCVRGVFPGISQGQQCCYNCQNKLILCPEDGAGTLDAYPGQISTGPWHYGHDVNPFTNCCSDQPHFPGNDECGIPAYHCNLNNIDVCNYYFVGRPSNYGKGGFACCDGKSPDSRCPCYSCAGTPFSPDNSSASGSNVYKHCMPQRATPRHKYCGCCPNYEDAPEIVWDGPDAPSTAAAYAAGLYIQESPAPAPAYDSWDIDFQDGR